MARKRVVDGEEQIVVNESKSRSGAAATTAEVSAPFETCGSCDGEYTHVERDDDDRARCPHCKQFVSEPSAF